jgi:hypothetical protein
MKMLRVLAISVVCFVVVFSGSVNAVPDNRYYPFLEFVLPRLEDRPSRIWFNGFYTQATKAYDDDGETVKTFAELFGKFDQFNLEVAMNSVGIDNPLFNDEWFKTPGQTNGYIVWNMQGQLQSQGLSFGWEQAFNRYCSIGIEGSLIHSYSDRSFELSQEARLGMVAFTHNGVFLDGQSIALDRARRNANDLLRLHAPIAEQNSFGDTSVYARLHVPFDYIIKCRNVDASLFFGGIIPTAPKRDLYNPAAIPLGGDGQWGGYVAFNGQLEMKEDWFVGLYASVMQRLSTRTIHRMPVADENPLWGVLVEYAKVHQGATFIISPYVALEDVQDGWGGMFRYTLVHHGHDFWSDGRSNPAHPARLWPLYRLSEWGFEYISFSLLYNGYKGVFNTEYAPRFYANFDVPVSLLSSQRIPKTYRFVLGFEFNF